MKSNGTEHEGSEAQGPSVRNQELGAQKARDRGQRLRDKGQVAGDQGAWGLGSPGTEDKGPGVCVLFDLLVKLKLGV